MQKGPADTIPGLEAFCGRVAIVASGYNRPVTEALLEGALGELRRAGVEETNIDVFWVPGAFELTAGVAAAERAQVYDAIVPLGCVVRGETYHFEVIADAVGRGLEEIGRSARAAVSLGLLTVNTIDQALERAGGRHGNKGEEAARAALALARLKRELGRHADKTKSA